MIAAGRLGFILLLTPACFRDQAPPSLTAGGSETGSTASSEPGSTSSATEPTTSSTSTSGESSTSRASETTCVPTAWFFDNDNDGHGHPDTMQLACSQPRGYVEVGDDCDDDNGARAPGLLELCDQQDNDCDPLVDEFSPMNPSCDDCWLGESGASSYVYCGFALTYQDARIECQKRGGDLTVIQSVEENTLLMQQVVALKGEASTWYIGLDDLASEGSFVWIDGTKLRFQAWGPLEPNNVDGIENCVVLFAGDGSWNDQQCAVASAFICEAVADP